MRVKELIEYLQGFDPDQMIIMSSDAEGNSYSPLADAEEAYYYSYNSWSGEVHSEESAEDWGYDIEDLEKRIVLYPVN